MIMLCQPALFAVLVLAAGEPVDLAEIMSGYKACVDWPAASFYKQLMEIYPDAKVSTLRFFLAYMSRAYRCVQLGTARCTQAYMSLSAALPILHHRLGTCRVHAACGITLPAQCMHVPRYGLVLAQHDHMKG